MYRQDLTVGNKERVIHGAVKMSVEHPVEHPVEPELVCVEQRVHSARSAVRGERRWYRGNSVQTDRERERERERERGGRGGG